MTSEQKPAWGYFYNAKGVRVERSSQDYRAYRLSIGRQTFELNEGDLEDIAVITDPAVLSPTLANYNPGLLPALSKKKIEPERFALILARVIIKHQKETIDSQRSEINSLADRVN